MKAQIVTLTLSDGRKVSALFPAFVESGGEITVVAVQVQAPFDDPSIEAFDAKSFWPTPRRTDA